MNRFECDVLNAIFSRKATNQREIATLTGLSLGLVNKSLSALKTNGFVTDEMLPTKKALSLVRGGTPKNAIILAAGFGMRMVPINTECSKGILSVHGERLIDRLITQLHEKNITDITVVVGFMKETYEYLMDKYNVSLVYNKDYATKNNLHSLLKVIDKIGSTYIMPCDIWCAKNFFSETELYSWAAVTKTVSRESRVRISKQTMLEPTKKNEAGVFVTGISYIAKSDAATFKKNVKALCKDSSFDKSFWEDALFNLKNIDVAAKIISSEDIVEINSYEELREFDSNSKNLKSDVIKIAASALNCKPLDIKNISTLKKGMTNRSFLFEVAGKKYIMRIPGEGTDKLINRKHEAEVYEKIKNHNLCDDVVYLNAKNGYKITKFIDNARCCDAYDNSDLQKCMKKLRKLHELKLQVKHEFDLFGQINFYQSLWGDAKSCFSDYEATKKNVFSLKKFIEKTKGQKVLSHIDSVPDNFLFSKNGGNEEIQLIDWEYAGMQDPLVDIAMFCIYALYETKSQIDKVIDFYFEEGCTAENRAKIYCYISVCGLLWSNWCEYKKLLGVEFGEYSLRQYRFAKDYFKIAEQEIKKLETQNS